MTIGKKLLCSFGATFGLLALLAVSAMMSIARLEAALTNTIDSGARGQLMAAEIDGAVEGLIADNRGVLLRGLMHDETGMREFHGKYSERCKQIEALTSALGPLLIRGETKAAFGRLRADFDRLKPEGEEISRLVEGGDIDGARNVLRDGFGPLAQETSKEAQFIVQQRTGRMRMTKDEATQTLRMSYWVVSVVSVLAVMLMGIVAVVVRGINGDLRAISAEIVLGADEIAGAAHQVAESSQELARGATHQAASIEETSSASMQVSSKTHQNAGNLDSTVELMQKRDKDLTAANGALREVVASMHGMNEANGEIAKIIHAIDQIAFQTNILALNAAVEAARAGDMGMGFAVVADEVRTLAQRSAESAQRTQIMIETAIGRSGECNAKVEQMAEKLASMMNRTKEIVELVEAVHTGGREQVSGIDQISQAVAQIEKVTHQTAAHAEESAATAEELNAQAATLHGLVERLESMVGRAA